MAAVPFKKREAANVEEPSTHRKENRNTPTAIIRIADLSMCSCSHSETALTTQFFLVLFCSLLLTELFHVKAPGAHCFSVNF